MSNISAGTTLTTALVNTGDTSGDLQLQVNGTTPSVTLKANGAIGVGSTPAYGTSGQVLTSQGSSASPTWSTVEALPSQTGNDGKYLTTNGTVASWGTVSSGALTLITSTAVTNVASITFTLNSTYDDYLILYDNLYPASGGQLKMRFNSDSGGNYTYSAILMLYNSGAVNQPNSSSNQTSIELSAGINSSNDGGVNGQINIFNANIAKPHFATFSGTTSGGGTSTIYTLMGGSQYSPSSALTSVTLFMSGGNFGASGNIRLYGYQKS